MADTPLGLSHVVPGVLRARGTTRESDRTGSCAGAREEGAKC